MVNVANCQQSHYGFVHRKGQSRGLLTSYAASRSEATSRQVLVENLVLMPWMRTRRRRQCTSTWGLISEREVTGHEASFLRADCIEWRIDQPKIVSHCNSDMMSIQ